jgi:hypothetical protein
MFRKSAVLCSVVLSLLVVRAESQAPKPAFDGRAAFD